MNEQTRTMPEDGPTYAGQMIREALMMLVEHDGLSTDDALAGAHAEIVTAMVRNYGGRVTAERCERAARVVSRLPSAAEVCTSAVPTAGRG